MLLASDHLSVSFFHWSNKTRWCFYWSISSSATLFSLVPVTHHICNTIARREKWALEQLREDGGKFDYSTCCFYIEFWRLNRSVGEGLLANFHKCFKATISFYFQYWKCKNCIIKGCVLYNFDKFYLSMIFKYILRN